MTDDQFIAVRDYVTRRLKDEASFSIPTDDLQKMFGLTAPFFREFCQRAGAAKLLFGADANWKEPEGDPSGPIRFYRRS